MILGWWFPFAQDVSRFPKEDEDGALDPNCNINDLDPTKIKTINQLFMEYFLYHPP